MLPLRRLAKYWLYTAVPGFAGRFPYYGTTVHFPPRAPLFRVICQNGRFEPEVIDRLIQLARPETTVFDVGANLGLMAIPILQACGSCRVVSFEPSPNSLPFLRQTMSTAPFRDRWTLIDKALSDHTGELDFTVGRPEDALFEGFKSGDRIAGARTIPVKVSTLDDEWRALGQPRVSAVKIDVEGAEGRVLEGGRQLFRHHKPAVIIEWHHDFLARFGESPDHLIGFAEAMDYRVFSIPYGIPITTADALRVSMFECTNFLLLPTRS